MKHTNSTESNLFPNKMYVKLNVLGALMMHRVGREIHCTDIVAVNNCGSVNRIVKLLH
jgi:hypothetical protein